MITALSLHVTPTEGGETRSYSSGDGQPIALAGAAAQGPHAPQEYRLELSAWNEHEVPEEDVTPDIAYLDTEHQVPFSGVIHPYTGAEGTGIAVADDGTTHASLYGDAVESGAPLTMLGFQRGLPGQWGRFIVLVSVLLFAVSTAISWSYYGDRCANYLFGPKAILPYKMVYVGMHFFGALVSLQVIWDLGDVALGIVILPNLLALVLLSGKVKDLTNSYFEREPWRENYEVHKQIVEDRRSHS